MNFRTIILFAFTLAWAAGCSAPAEEKVKSAKELMQRVPESNIQVPAATDQCIRGRATCEALGLKIRREFAPGYAGLTWMYECVAAAQSGDFASLQSWIHPDHGFFLIHKPGAAPTFQHFVAATDLAGSAWENFAVKGRKPRNLTQEDIFMTAPYRVTPEWSKDAAHIIPPITCRTEGNFIYWNQLVKALEESNMLSVKPDIRKKIDEIGKLVHMELFFDQFFYFGEIDDKWYLLALDIARSDFSA